MSRPVNVTLHGDWELSQEFEGSTATFFARFCADRPMRLLIHAAVASWSRLSESAFLFIATMFDFKSISASIIPRSPEGAVTSISGPSSSSVVSAGVASAFTAPADDLRPALELAVVRGELFVAELFCELFEDDFSGRLSNAKHSKLLDGSASESASESTGSAESGGGNRRVEEFVASECET